MKESTKKKWASRLKNVLTVCLLMAVTGGNEMRAQGWPENYGGVMLQGFYWDSYSATQWTRLEGQADDLAATFSLIWIPQSANCGGQSMGYDDLYWFSNYDSSFGSEAALRSMIRTFRDKGLGTIADVVINHRKNVSNWVDFPRETYNGVTYELTSTDIVANDDAGATLTWATQNGYSLSANNDTGEGWNGMRDLDHKSANVQQNVKAYLNMLLQDLGYTGFRYDMVKGYSAEFTRMYNTSAQPQFSVGECWDGSNTIRNWIDGTAQDGTPTSAAFDFQFRYTVRNAANTGVWSNLGKQNDGNWPLVSSSFQQGNYRRWAVTFVENHDTERRSNAEQDPLKKDTLAANAYMLAMPGTPCIFLKHWQAYRPELKAMVDVRRLAGINNTSSYTNMRSADKYYANLVKTNNENRLMVVVGSDLQTYVPSEAQWKEVLAGYHYKYYVPRTMETAWADRATGTYDEPFDVTLRAVSETDGAQLVYTLDGTTPTAQSTQAADGTKLHIDGDCTLTVGLLAGGTVSSTSIVQRKFTFRQTEKRVITVCVNADAVPGWTTMNFWTWGGDDSHAPKNGSWPGDRISETRQEAGKTWYVKSFTLNADDDFVNFVFSAGNGSPQTVNVENVREDRYFEVLNERDGANYKVKDVTQSTDISLPTTDTGTHDGAWYTLSGQRVARPAQPGIYVRNGRKVVVK